MHPIEIGAQQIYDKLVGLDEKFDTFAADADKRLALLEQRVNTLETGNSKKWKTNLALLGASASLIGAFIAPLVVR